MAAPPITVAELHKLIGRTVVNRNDQILGTLHKVIAGQNNQIQKVIIRHGGFLGLFQDDSVIDWQSAKPRIQAGKLVLAVTPDRQYSAQASE